VNILFLLTGFLFGFVIGFCAVGIIQEIIDERNGVI